MKRLSAWPMVIVSLICGMLALTRAVGIVPPQGRINLCSLHLAERILGASDRVQAGMCDALCTQDESNGWWGCFREAVLAGDFSQAASLDSGFPVQGERDLMSLWAVQTGDLLREQGRTAEATAIAAFVDDLQIQSSLPLYRLGFLWRELNIPDKAIAAFKKAQQVDTVCPEAAQFRQGQIQYWNKLDKEDALENLGAAFHASCIPDDERQSAALMSANLLLEGGRLDLALERYRWVESRLAGQTSRLSSQVQAGIGQIVEAQGDAALADQYYSTAYVTAQTISDKRIALALLGRILARQSQWAGAYVYLQQAQLLSPSPDVASLLDQAVSAAPCLADQNVPMLSDLDTMRALALEIGQRCR